MLSGDVLVGIAIACCVAGFILNSTYAKKNGKAAIRWKQLSLLLICIGVGLLVIMLAGVVVFGFLWAH